jgi:hypothetical protein
MLTLALTPALDYGENCMKIRLLVGLAAAILVGPTLAYGQANELAELRAEIRALTSRLVALEANQAEVAEVRTPAVAPAPLFEGVKLKADFRYRHNTIDEAGLERRDRNRIRARIGITGDVTDDVEVGFRLSSGGTNPVSGNQNLDTGFSRKSIGFDLAYFKWKFTDQLTVSGGKIPNPFYRAGGNGLIWDSDLNPEGLALAIGGGALSASVAGLWVEERSGSSDSMMLGAQLTYAAALGSGAKLKVGGSYFDYLKAQGSTPFFNGSGAGNLLDINGNYPTDFNELELFAELSTQLADQPLVVFLDYVTNTEATNFDTGWAVGAKYGKASDPGTWEAGYTYHDLEANAVIATFSDSDFGGGGTDGRGHIFRAGYALNKKMKLALTYFLNERGVNAGNKRDFDRLALDMNFKY